MARITPYTYQNRTEFTQESCKHLHQQKNKFKLWERYNRTVKITEIWSPNLILLLSESYDFAQKCVFTKI